MQGIIVRMTLAEEGATRQNQSSSLRFTAVGPLGC